MQHREGREMLRTHLRDVHAGAAGGAGARVRTERHHDALAAEEVLARRDDRLRDNVQADAALEALRQQAVHGRLGQERVDCAESKDEEGQT